jgi:hypothetical protein
MPTYIAKAKREYQFKSLFDLHVAKQQTNPGSPDHQAIVALIEVRKERRDWWTLVAALIAAAASVVGLFLSH